MAAEHRLAAVEQRATGMDPQSASPAALHSAASAGLGVEATTAADVTRMKDEAKAAIIQATAETQRANVAAAEVIELKRKPTELERRKQRESATAAMDRVSYAV